jgi:predicted nucleic acid-binding protein
MNIIDSSCWLEYLMDTEIGAAVAPVIENPAELIVPTITLYEVYKKLLAEKGGEYALDVVSYMQSGTVIDLSAGLSLSAAQISRSYKLPMADSIIRDFVALRGGGFFLR